VPVADALCVTIGSGCVVRVLSRAFHRFRGVTTKAAAAFWADDGRESLRFNRWESINNNIFDPVGMVTRTAAVFVPTAGNRVEFQELVPDRIRHIVVPQVFPEIIRIF